MFAKEFRLAILDSDLKIVQDFVAWSMENQEGLAHMQGKVLSFHSPHGVLTLKEMIDDAALTPFGAVKTLRLNKLTPSTIGAVLKLAAIAHDYVNSVQHIHQLGAESIRCDDNFQRALETQHGDNAGDMRYEPACDTDLIAKCRIEYRVASDKFNTAYRAHYYRF